MMDNNERRYVLDRIMAIKIAIGCGEGKHLGRKERIIAREVSKIEEMCK